MSHLAPFTVFFGFKTTIALLHKLTWVNLLHPSKLTWVNLLLPSKLTQTHSKKRNFRED
jgi:hypothetical protein